MTARKIGLLSLVLLITGAIDSIRNLPTTALFGPTLIFFFIAAAILFLLPTGLVSAELSSTWHDKGGIYQWTKLAHGEKVALLPIWLQWINTMVWYPTILSFIAGTLAYLINPHLAQNKVYLVTVILAVFWLMTLLNLKGLKVSANFASFCGLIGMVVPMFLVVILGIIWLVLHRPMAIHLTLHNWLPHFGHGESWISLTAIITAFLGMELATVHVQQVYNPQKTFPKALSLSITFILFTMIFGSLAIAVVLPASKINLVDGIMAAFQQFFINYHMQWFLPVVGIMILLGSVGGMINWMISPAKGLMQVAEQGYLPKWFSYKNKHDVASHVLIVQAILVSLMCTAFLLMPSVNGSYWLLTDLSTELYVLMYIFMFIAALVIKYKYAHLEKGFQIPGGKFGMWLCCLAGILGCAIAFIIGFLPPSSINVGSASHYYLTFSIGLVLMISPVLLLYAYKKYRDAS